MLWAVIMPTMRLRVPFRNDVVWFADIVGLRHCVGACVRARPGVLVQLVRVEALLCAGLVVVCTTPMARALGRHMCVCAQTPALPSLPPSPLHLPLVRAHAHMCDL